jgi:hypothetical protein
MTLTKTIIDTASKQTLTFVERAVGGADTEGNPEASDTTIATATGDIQPAPTSQLLESAGGSVAHTGRGSTVTHVAFVEERVSGVAEKMLILDENSVEYTIVAIHDFRGAPQEFDLRQN